MKHVNRILTLAVLLASGLWPAGLQPVRAGGASMYVSAPSSVTVGQTVTVNVMVNTNGQSANSFDATISFPANLFDPVRGATGSVCNLYVSQPDPSQNPDEFQCGKSNGFTGSGSIGSIVLTAKAAGSGSFGLRDCQVLANDGQGTDITGGCSGSGVSVSAPATPPPAAAAPVKSSTPKPAASASAKPSSSQTPKPAETPQTPVPTVAPTPPPVQPLPSQAPASKTAASAVPTAASGSNAPAPEQRRTVGKALSDLFASFKTIGKSPKDVTGTVALLLALLPTMAIFLAILFFLYRLLAMEKRRRKTLDRLFEMELSELSALEGKMDLLSEKGAKGKEQYKEEFEKAKANILREIHPDYGKPVDPPARYYGLSQAC